jgi:NAD-dependent DNA ligase
MTAEIVTSIAGSHYGGVGKILARVHKDLPSVAVLICSGAGNVGAVSLHATGDDLDELIAMLSVIRSELDDEVAATSSGTRDLEYVSLVGQMIVVTGKIPGWNRDEINDMILAAGGIPCNSVSSSTDLLFIGVKPGATKLDAARSASVPMWSWAHLLRAAGEIDENGMDLVDNDIIAQAEAAHGAEAANIVLTARGASSVSV